MEAKQQLKQQRGGIWSGLRPGSGSIPTKNFSAYTIV
jgi:hypothetical protein